VRPPPTTEQDTAEHEDLVRSPLAVLGIGAASERAYRAALRSPGSDLASLGSTTGRSPDRLRADLEPLVALDLVRIIGDVVQPEPPSFALRKIVARESRRLADTARSLELAESMVHRYVTEHRAAQRVEQEPLTIDVIPARQLIDVLETLVPTTTGEMLFLRPDQWHLPDGQQMDEYVIEALRAGRASRVIYPLEILERPVVSLERRARAGEQVRVLRNVPSRMAVFGHAAVVLPDRWGDPEMVSALLLREPSVVTACRALFDLLWSRGSTVPSFHVDGNETGRRQLMELLSRGAKDEQISRALGLSLRTVRRRVAAMMVELGVDTRFQAGMEAVRRGWL
jgi:DNA-binding CsgD family transcriptional regulator